MPSIKCHSFVGFQRERRQAIRLIVVFQYSFRVSLQPFIFGPHGFLSTKFTLWWTCCIDLCEFQTIRGRQSCAIWLNGNGTTLPLVHAQEVLTHPCYPRPPQHLQLQHTSQSQTLCGPILSTNIDMTRERICVYTREGERKKGSYKQILVLIEQFYSKGY